MLPTSEIDRYQLTETVHQITLSSPSRTPPSPSADKSTDTKVIRKPLKWFQTLGIKRSSVLWYNDTNESHTTIGCKTEFIPLGNFRRGNVRHSDEIGGVGYKVVAAILMHPETVVAKHLPTGLYFPQKQYVFNGISIRRKAVSLGAALVNIYGDDPINKDWTYGDDIEEPEWLYMSKSPDCTDIVMVSAAYLRRSETVFSNPIVTLPPTSSYGEHTVGSDACPQEFLNSSPSPPPSSPSNDYIMIPSVVDHGSAITQSKPAVFSSLEIQEDAESIDALLPARCSLNILPGYLHFKSRSLVQ
ncbi:hypothetical protein H072_11354 [Dactylellina haptotyla CBS 200.50]|uniref:Uncharacterized protein n=1 Tax=Dactylellina haptotyla (strain CBS 200.50) TaxID=1284197 RepID=S7ZX24_DACHA|nr:hypothetical protein H072_11354 [Dactylellina haptotyla CBS 200.50]